MTPPLQQSANMRRRVFPFSFGITREGALYIILVFLLSLASVNTGNNLLFMILATSLSAIVVSGIVSHYSLKQISISLYLPENVFVGERVPVKVTAKNRKRIIPSFSIRVEDPDLNRTPLLKGILRRLISHIHRKASIVPASSDRAILRQSAYFALLRPGEARSELALQSFPHRGLYSLDGLLISTCFPFGFFRRGEHIGAKGEVLVYPFIQDISSFFHLLPFLTGSYEGKRAGRGDDLFSIRKYQEGESARAIDWKATAKTGALMAREFAQDEELRFCLILDTWIHSQTLEGHISNFEKAVSLAASIVAHFLEEGAGMEFLTPHEHVPRGAGRDQLHRILRLLAMVRSEKMPAMAPFNFWSQSGFPCIANPRTLRKIFSDKVFKIILTSKPRGSLPSGIWRSSHVIFFDEL